MIASKLLKSLRTVNTHGIENIYETIKQSVFLWLHEGYTKSEKSQIKEEKMKTIVVKWVEEKEWGYGKAMRVIESDHERFIKGSRFDYGFFGIATDEGYTIISLPMDT